MTKLQTPPTMKNYAYELERFLNQHGIPCQAVKVTDTFLLTFVFEVTNFDFDVKQLAKIPTALSICVDIDVDSISIRIVGSLIYLSLPCKQKVFSFSDICNNDMNIRQDKAFKDYLLLPIGIKENGDIAYLNLSKNIHWSIIGASQQGKTNALLNIILNLLLHSKGKVQLYLIDFLKSKFDIFNNTKNILVSSTKNQTIHNLSQLCKIIDDRYKNNKDKHYPIFVVIDELQQALSQCPEICEYIEKISSMGLEANLKLIVGTQKLSIGTIEGLKNTKNNILGTVQFKVKDKTEGNQLYNKDTSYLNVGQAIIDDSENKELIQWSFVSNKELHNIISKLPTSNLQYSEKSPLSRGGLEVCSPTPNDLIIKSPTSPLHPGDGSGMRSNPQSTISDIPLELWEALSKTGDEVSNNKLRQELGKGMDYAREQIENLIKLQILQRQDGNNKPCLLTDYGKTLINQFKLTGYVGTGLDLSTSVNISQVNNQPSVNSKPTLTLVYSKNSQDITP